MSKYIKEFNQTGNSIVNVELICKDWNNQFSIATWVNDSEEKFTFIVNRKRGNTRLCKTQISKEQAFKIAENLNLIHVRDTTFRSAGSFCSKEFINHEIDRITKIKHQKQLEISLLSQVLFKYERAL